MKRAELAAKRHQMVLMQRVIRSPLEYIQIHEGIFYSW